MRLILQISVFFLWLEFIFPHISKALYSFALYGDGEPYIASDGSKHSTRLHWVLIFESVLCVLAGTALAAHLITIPDFLE